MTPAIAAAIAVPIVFALLAKTMPYRPPTDVECHESLEVLSQRYRVWEVGALVPFFAFAALFTGGWYLLFTSLQALVLAQLPVSELRCTLPAAAWLVPALLLGIVTSAIPLHFIYRYLLGDRYAEYTHYGNLRVGFDGWKVFRLMAIVFGVGAALFVIWGLDCYTLLTADGITHNSILSLGRVEERPFADVKEVRRIAKFTAPNGNVVERPYFQIVFQDGSILSTRELMCEDRDAPKLAEAVSRHARTPIMSFEFAP